MQLAVVGIAKDKNPYDPDAIDAAKRCARTPTPPWTAATSTVGVTGAAAQALDSQDASAKAEAIVGLTTFGLILLLMVVIFRSVILAVFPLLVIGLVSQVAVGLIGAANKVFDLKTDSSIQVILIVVLFGIGTDYILFFLFRYRERLRLGEEHKTAVAQAVARAGEAILSAGGAVIVSFMALILSSLGIFKSIGPALAIAVAVTVRRGADAGAGRGLAARHQDLLAVEVLEEGAEVRPVRRDRPVARAPPRGVRRLSPAWCSRCWRSSPCSSTRRSTSVTPAPPRPSSRRSP